VLCKNGVRNLVAGINTAFGGLPRIPMHDLVALVRCVITLSPVACVTQIDVPAITDVTA